MLKGQNRTVILLMTHTSFFLSHRLPLAHHLRSAGFRVIIAAHADVPWDRSLSEHFEFAEIGFTRRGLNPLKELLSILQITMLYRRTRPAIVHHFAHKAIVYGGLAVLVAGVRKAIGTFPGLGYAFTATGVVPRAARTILEVAHSFVLKRAYALVSFQNPDDRRHFTERRIVSPRQSRLVRGSGVDCRKFLPSAEPDHAVPVVLTPGRMLWSKGIADVVEAARVVRAKGRVVRFILAGTGGDDNAQSIPIETLARWNAEGVVQWIGQSIDMAALIASSTIICLPSHREGLPLALAEAAASGRPIVTADAPGCREVVRHGVNGYLVKVGDPRQLAARIEELLDDRELRLRMGRAGRALAESNYSIDRILEQTADLYAECLTTS